MPYYLFKKVYTICLLNIDNKDIFYYKRCKKIFSNIFLKYAFVINVF